MKKNAFVTFLICILLLTSCFNKSDNIKILNVGQIVNTKFLKLIQHYNIQYKFNEDYIIISNSNIDKLKIS